MGKETVVGSAMDSSMESAMGSLMESVMRSLSRTIYLLVDPIYEHASSVSILRILDNWFLCSTLFLVMLRILDLEQFLHHHYNQRVGHTIGSLFRKS